MTRIDAPSRLRNLCSSHHHRCSDTTVLPFHTLLRILQLSLCNRPVATSIMSDTTVYRASTTAPVNIAVIK